MLNDAFPRLYALFHRLLSLLPATLSSHIYALLFTLHLGLNLPISPPLQTTTTTLKVANDTLETHLISNPNRPTSHTARTVLLIHGLSVSAHNDPRFLHLARSICAAQPNSTVIIPYLPPLAECDLAKPPVQLISAVIAAVSADPTLCPTARLSLVSPCISAGFSLVAAMHHPPTVHAVLTIGTHASVRNVLKHAVEREGKDDSRYGVNAVLSSFLRPRTALRSMLVAYVSDDHYRNLGRPADELHRLLRLHPEDAKLYHRLHEDPHYLKAQLHHVYAANERAFLDMSPLERLDELKCDALALIHASQDDIVPSSESVALSDALKGRKDMRTALCVTALLNHGDQKAVRMADVLEAMRLISAFATFFLPDCSLAAARKRKTA